MESVFISIASSLAFVLLVLSIVLFVEYKKAKLRCSKNESLAAEQAKEIESRNKIIKNLSGLYENAIQYDKSITDFFSNITHDLKTPISVILGAIQLLDLKKLAISNEQELYLRNYQVIRHNCYRLLRLANNLLDFARLDSGYLKINLTNCNIVYLAEEITQSVLPFAAQKQIELLFDTQHEEINTAVDIDKIERVLLNLLSNAIKFTSPGGRIYVTVGSSEEKVSISVKDTGIGIPESSQKEIFERFHQVSSKLSKDYEGSGIGLSLVKSFVDLHQGYINVSSKENEGSEFVIMLPIHQLDEHGKKDDEPAVTDRQVKITEAVSIEFSNTIAL